MFCENSVLRNFPKYTVKHLYKSLFFNKAAGPSPNFIKKETLAQVFSCEFCEVSKNTFSYRMSLMAASDSRYVLEAPDQSDNWNFCSVKINLTENTLNMT